jgi:hypothetical protein
VRARRRHFGEKVVPHAVRPSQLDMQELRPSEQDGDPTRWIGEVRILRARHEDPAEQHPRRGNAGSNVAVRAVHAVSANDRPRAEGIEARFERGFDAEKRQALVALRDRYVEARGLETSGQQHANLDWILGARRNPTQDPLEFETKTIELVALWLQDLTRELERRLPEPARVIPETGAPSANDVREATALKLRGATEAFLAAFRRRG